MKQRAAALTDAQLFDQLCDLLIPKLEERLAKRLPTKAAGRAFESLMACQVQVKSNNKPFCCLEETHELR